MSGFQAQKLFYLAYIGLVQNSELVKVPFLLFGLFGQDVAVVSVLPFDFTGSGKGEPLF